MVYALGLSKLVTDKLHKIQATCDKFSAYSKYIFNLCGTQRFKMISYSHTATTQGATSGWNLVFSVMSKNKHFSPGLWSDLHPSVVILSNALFLVLY